MVRRQNIETGLKSIHRNLRLATDTMLKAWILSLPNGYMKGLELIDEPKFNEAKNHLSSQIQAGSTTGSSDETRWRLVNEGLKKGMYQGLCNCRENTYLVGNGSAPRLRNLFITT